MYHSEKLMQNFFMVGISQEKLVKLAKDQVDRGNSSDSMVFPPELLFSLYNDAKDCEKYTKFVFPSDV